MFLRSLLKAGQQQTTQRPTQMIRPTFRSFSSGQMKPPTGSSGGMMMPGLMIGGSCAAFAYLAYTISDMNRNKMKYMAEGHTYMHPVVQQRIAKTLGYFSYGIFATAGTVYTLRNSMIWASIPWYVGLAASIGMMYGTLAIDYERMFPLKLAMFTGFAGVTGMFILPLI